MQRGDRAPQAFQAPVDVHASADGQVYMFRRKPHESSDDEDLSVLELRPRVHQEQERDWLRNIQLLEREVSDGDSLNKLALQYGCKVADIKRVNSLMQDQDLFALKSIKIPVQKHSLFTETQSDQSDFQEEEPHPSSAAMTFPHRARTQTHLREVTDFLMEVDSHIEKLIQTTDDQEKELRDDLMPAPQRFGFKGKRLSGQGADLGLQWWNAVVAMLLIGIVLPLFYIIYFKTINSAASPPADGSSTFQPSNASGTDSGSKPG